MKPPSFMLIAGEASGDLLAAELVGALRDEVISAGSAPVADVQPLRSALAPRFFGAGGAQMAAAGVELALDLTRHSVIGVSDAAEKGFAFGRRLLRLRRLAVQQQPDVIVLVDFSFFNHLFARIIRGYVARHRSAFNNWSPKIVKYVSPQVWASRPGRADRMPRDFDLLLSIFPFEKDWFARRVPRLPVVFVGHPMVGRYGSAARQGEKSEVSRSPRLLLLPGSRTNELKKHLPPMLGALRQIRSQLPGVRATMVLPSESLAQLAKSFGPDAAIQVGGLAEALAQTDVALSKTGTVTMECAFFGIPTVTFYKTSWTTYHIARRIVTVKSLTMPNLLAGAEVFPEFIQDDATADNLGRAVLQLLQDENRQRQIKTQLAQIVASLGEPGASRRAAAAIVNLIQ